jgi:hypothetical protein
MDLYYLSLVNCFVLVVYVASLMFAVVSLPLTDSICLADNRRSNCDSDISGQTTIKWQSIAQVIVVFLMYCRRFGTHFWLPSQRCVFERNLSAGPVAHADFEQPMKGKVRLGDLLFCSVLFQRQQTEPTSRLSVHSQVASAIVAWIVPIQSCIGSSWYMWLFTVTLLLSSSGFDATSCIGWRPPLCKSVG